MRLRTLKTYAYARARICVTPLLIAAIRLLTARLTRSAHYLPPLLHPMAADDMPLIRHAADADAVRYALRVARRFCQRASRALLMLRRRCRYAAISPLRRLSLCQYDAMAFYASATLLMPLLPFTPLLLIA